MAGAKLKTTMDLSPLKKLAKKSPQLFQKSMARAGIQMLTWMNAGSGKSSKKPPIRWGVLRGSSSVFVGSKLVQIFAINVLPGAGDAPTPAREHRAPTLTLTFVWNTDYAAKMHEHRGGWGPHTERDGNAGAHWIDEHLRADRNDLMKFIAKDVGNAMGMS